MLTTQQDCQTKLAVAPSLASKHLRMCEPCCSNCFYRYYCRRWDPQGQRIARNRECCELRDHQIDVEMALTARAATDTKKLCRICASLPPAQRMERLEARDRLQLDRLERHPLACSKCRSMLPTGGPRWWVCEQCLTECRSRMHPAWGEK